MICRDESEEKHTVVRQGRRSFQLGWGAQTGGDQQKRKTKYLHAKKEQTPKQTGAEASVTRQMLRPEEKKRGGNKYILQTSAWS